MKGDFSRIRFEATNRFSRVLKQQGRVTLDADDNEQTDILLHYLRTLARDLIGDYGGPLDGGGFSLSIAEGKLMIGAGRYYVHGILCECDGCDYADQPDLKPALDAKKDALLAFLKEPNGKIFWVYLDVWERHLTSVEVPELREVALGGPDTCTRSKVIWQVKARALTDIAVALDARQKDLTKRINAGGDAATVAVLKQRLARVTKAINDLKDPATACAAPLEDMVDAEGTGMAARLEKSVQPKTPCIIAPDARYRGAENQLYRVEIHQGGSAGQATFKWSRDNGSIVTDWLGGTGNQLQVANVRGFCAGAWVELSDDAHDLRGEPGVLVRITKVEDDTLTIDAASVAVAATITRASKLHSKVRCWDQVGDGIDTGVPLLVAGSQGWINLEDGIQVRFAVDGEYRSGDYWLIPARVAGGVDGGVDWNDGEQLAPRRVEHHYAPLGFVALDDGGEIQASSCLCTLQPLTPCQLAQTNQSMLVGAAVIHKTTPVGKPLTSPSVKTNLKPKSKPKPKHA